MNQRELAAWISAAVALAIVAVSARGCAVARADRARFAADAKRSADALTGSNNNLAALKLAVEHKDERIHELTESAKHTGCDGTWTEITRPDGTVERRCVGKARSDETESGRKDKDVITPSLPPPFTPPVPLQPSALASGSSRARWSVDVGAGGTIAPVRLPVYCGAVGYRLIGPVWVRAWGTGPAPIGGYVTAGLSW